MWRQRANRVLFSVVVFLTLAPLGAVLIAVAPEAGRLPMAVFVVLAMLTFLAVVEALRRLSHAMRWLPEPCLPPYHDRQRQRS